MFLKHHVKRVIGTLCSGRLLRPLVSSTMRQSVNVVYYHFIGQSAPHYESFYTGCTIERFARDIEQLSRVFDFASLTRVVHSREPEHSSRKPVIAVTFDDGFDLYRSEVLNILDRYQVQATTFVITSCIDNHNLMWRHKLSVIRALTPDFQLIKEYNDMAKQMGCRLINSTAQLMQASSQWDMNLKDRLAAELWDRCGLDSVTQYLDNYRPYFTLANLRMWLNLGHSVGFHTHTHPYCSRLAHDDVEPELMKPAKALRDQLRLKELFLSYPFGQRLPHVVEDEVYAQGVFDAMFGIDGFKKKGISKQRLERAGIEHAGADWPVFARPLLGI